MVAFTCVLVDYGLQWGLEDQLLSALGLMPLVALTATIIQWNISSQSA